MAGWSILELLRSNPEALKEHVRKRLMDPAIVDRAYSLDVEWRRLLTRVNEVRRRHNEITRMIAKAGSREERERLIAEAKSLLREREELEEMLKRLRGRGRRLY